MITSWDFGGGGGHPPFLSFGGGGGQVPTCPPGSATYDL